jgi:hypothetical protein
LSASIQEFSSGEQGAANPPFRYHSNNRRPLDRPANPDVGITDLFARATRGRSISFIGNSEDVATSQVAPAANMIFGITTVVAAEFERGDYWLCRKKKNAHAPPPRIFPATTDVGNTSLFAGKNRGRLLAISASIAYSPPL